MPIRLSTTLPIYRQAPQTDYLTNAIGLTTLKKALLFQGLSLLELCLSIQTRDVLLRGYRVIFA